MDTTALDLFVVTTVATILVSLSAMAAVKIQPGVVRWGFNKVIGWFR